jgi:hypothetical protein
MPEGSTLLGRWHAPGSVNGWLLVETDKPETVYVHAAEWGAYLDWKTTPVLTDEQAGAASAAASDTHSSRRYPMLQLQTQATSRQTPKALVRKSR